MKAALMGTPEPAKVAPAQEKPKERKVSFAETKAPAETRTEEPAENTRGRGRGTRGGRGARGRGGADNNQPRPKSGKKEEKEAAKPKKFEDIITAEEQEAKKAARKVKELKEE